ncbi:hypothetical protein D917_07159 [Trichinella nativa]|uniref:RRM domain-containing protein n=1 Tax=Trichinella nativa TaxID=6335 RepID=A0A1Y3ETN2_9BILA|nr:hypothetical protein D917_07159 [Trichinella nativa]
MEPRPGLLDTTMTELRHSIEHGAVLRNFLFEIFSLSAQDPLILFKYNSMLYKLYCFTQERRNFVHNMIFVEIFNGRTTTEHLFSHFSSYGKVLHVEIRPENPHVAIVTFQTAAMARSACYICKEFHFPNCTIIFYHANPPVRMSNVVCIRAHAFRMYYAKLHVSIIITILPLL